MDKPATLAGALHVDDLDALREGKEFMRLWSTDKGAICLIDPASLGADPFAFGLAMVDAIRHGAKAYAQAVNISENHAFERIMEGFKAEFENPTDLPKAYEEKEVH